MCGIAGKIDMGGGVPGGLVEAMCDAIVHRGPDSRGVHCEDGVGLGVQRLAVIDLQTGDQPIANEDGSVVLVLNGEIYNYRELREGLLARGHRFSTATDTEVIVHLYEERGADCVRALRGMFAFALWDQRRRRLLLARDRLGKKPLFFRADAGRLWFGSELRAILQDPQVPRRPDPRALDAYLRFGYVPHPLSAFAGIEKLPPAHVLVWEDGQVATRRYWQLDYSRKSAASPREQQEEVRELIRESVRLRMRSDVPVGAFLSGGVDSSAVVAAMAQQGGGTIRTFSIGFDEERYDETRHARAVAERYGTEHHEHRVSSSAMELLPRLVWHYGEPFADSSAIPSFALSDYARRYVTVALNGDGGDEAYGGYQRYLAMQMGGWFDRLPAPIRRAVRRAALLAKAGGSTRQLRSRLRRAAVTASLPPVDRYAQLMSQFTDTGTDAVWTAGFRRAIGDPRPADRWIPDAWRAAAGTGLLDTLLAVDVETYLPGDLLVKMDIASMAHSLELRSPLLDHVLLEHAARLPQSRRLHRGQTKHVLKEAVRPWLPDEVIDRPKMGFAVPISSWFRGPLRDLPGEILLDPASLARDMYREDAVRRLVAEHQAGRADHGSEIWSLLQLELWMRTFIDAGTPAPLAALDT